jgi:hypothetical protein
VVLEIDSGRGPGSLDAARLLTALLVLALAGCAGAEREDRAVTSVEPSMDGAEGGDSDGGAGTLSSPYDERPGGDAGEEAPRGPGARFVSPSAELRAGRGPAVSTPARLMVVAVRDGRLVHDPQLLLALDEALADAEGLRAVTALTPVRLDQVSLGDLARLAGDAGADLLLVDVVADERTGYVLHTAGGQLLAQPRAGQPPSLTSSWTGGAVASVVDAYTRLEAR